MEGIPLLAMLVTAAEEWKLKAKNERDPMKIKVPIFASVNQSAAGRALDENRKRKLKSCQPGRFGWKLPSRKAPNPDSPENQKKPALES